MVFMHKIYLEYGSVLQVGCVRLLPLICYYHLNGSAYGEAACEHIFFDDDSSLGHILGRQFIINMHLM